MSFDRRLTPARDDLAAEHLRGQIDAPRYAAGDSYRVTSPTAPLRARPDTAAAYDTELLYGEDFEVYDIAAGWAWGQSVSDGYVGYIPQDALAPAHELAAPTHRVCGPSAQVYAEPRLKLPPVATLPYGARLCAGSVADGYVEIGPHRWVPLPQVSELDRPASDWVAEAERFLSVPYVWGGRSFSGLDCSALVQLARQAGGFDCPRDSDMQEAAATSLPAGAPPSRGDLMFWRGHVGILLDAERLLHANAHHMAVAIESLADAVSRIERSGDGKVTSRGRLDPA